VVERVDVGVSLGVNVDVIDVLEVTEAVKVGDSDVDCEAPPDRDGVWEGVNVDERVDVLDKVCDTVDVEEAVGDKVKVDDCDRVEESVDVRLLVCVTEPVAERVTVTVTDGVVDQVVDGVGDADGVGTSYSQ
jgi:hypothetical protein